jgi:hypothetical protein
MFAMNIGFLTPNAVDDLFGIQFYLIHLLVMVGKEWLFKPYV